MNCYRLCDLSKISYSQILDNKALMELRFPSTSLILERVFCRELDHKNTVNK